MVVYRNLPRVLLCRGRSSVLGGREKRDPTEVYGYTIVCIDGSLSRPRS